jgi:uncharacterized LabA/DUF88 family protein
MSVQLAVEDGDLSPLAQAVRRRGVRVAVVSIITSQPPMIADKEGP